MNLETTLFCLHQTAKTIKSHFHFGGHRLPEGLVENQSPE